MKKGLLFTLLAYAFVWLIVGIFWLSGKPISSPWWALVAAACMFMPLAATIM